MMLRSLRRSVPMARPTQLGCAVRARIGRNPVPSGRGRSLCTPAGKPVSPSAAVPAAAEAAPGFSYLAFAKAYPFTNNVLIATVKTSAADLVAQCVIERKPVAQIDWQRNLVFCLFGAVYLGAFQYWYQVNIFKRVFSGAERFTNLPWSAKVTDVPGLLTLAGQTAVDIGVLIGVYLPTFYVFKAGVFSGAMDPAAWVSSGLAGYTKNWNKDVSDLVMVWAPADIVCFSVPLWLRLPVRHIVSFVWTAYLSFVRGSK